MTDQYSKVSHADCCVAPFMFCGFIRGSAGVVGGSTRVWLRAGRVVVVGGRRDAVVSGGAYGALGSALSLVCPLRVAPGELFSITIAAVQSV